MGWGNEGALKSPAQPAHTADRSTAATAMRRTDSTKISDTCGGFLKFFGLFLFLLGSRNKELWAVERWR